MRFMRFVASGRENILAERKNYLLRIDPALWKELEAWAAADLRSVNGQIEFLLRDAVERRKKGDPKRLKEKP